MPDLYLGNRGVGESRTGAEMLSEAAAFENEDRLDLRAIFAIFVRRIRLFFIVFLLVLATTALLTFSQQKVYTAYAEVVLNTRNTASPQVLEGLTEAPRGEAEISTELRILSSRELAADVANRLDLVHDADFNPLLRERKSPIDGLLGFIEADESGRPVPTESELAALQPQVIEIVRSGLGAVRIGNAYSLRIAYSHPNPVRAAELANAYAEAYVNDQRDVKRETGQQVAEFLKERIEELRKQAQADVRDVQQYRIRNNMLSTTGATLTEQDISALNQQLAHALAKAAEDTARLDTARALIAAGSFGDDLGESLSSGVVQSLRVQRAGLSARVAELRGRYGSLHPDLKKAQRELADIDVQIQIEIDRIVSSLAAQAEVSRQRVASLTRSLNASKEELTRNTRAMVELDDLQRRAETSQALYESYLNSYKETVAREGTEQADARVLSEAQVPGAPSSPRVLLNLFFGAVMGAGLGVALSFMTELNFSGLTTGKEVEERIKAPYLGLVPSNKTASPRGDTVLHTIAKYRQSPMSESLSSLLTSIQFATEQRAKVLYVTSAVPEEGKTTLAAALGTIAAIRGEKAVVVDCDRVRRGLQRMIDASGSAGLRDVLEGKASLDSALVEDQATGCWYLPFIRGFPRSFRLNKPDGSFGALIAQLKERFDTVILDGAPILPVSEARELAGYADYVVMAVRWRKTPHDAVREAIKLLPSRVRGATGVALTRVNLKQHAWFGIGDRFVYYQKYKTYYLPKGAA